VTRTIDTERLRHEHPIARIIAGYGIPLRSCGRTLVGRCPFHQDRGRPNLVVYPETQSWFCFRCNVGGDVISFVERLEGLSFRDAVDRLTGSELSKVRRTTSSAVKTQIVPHRQRALGPAQRACLAAAVDLYHNRLQSEPAALAYLDDRGIDWTTLLRCRVGFAADNDLITYLQWSGLPIAVAIRMGLLRPDGRDFLAGRIVVPELRAGQPIWLIGRMLGSALDAPKYLALPGPKPLLGLGTLPDARDVFVAEGVFDWLTLRVWNYPAVALSGIHVRVSLLRALDRFTRIYLVLDSDETGEAATRALISVLGDRVLPVTLPGVKDVADLAHMPEGRERFARAVAESERLSVVAA
jgi:DNA primase